MPFNSAQAHQFIFRGRAADRNPLAAPGAERLGERLSRETGLKPMRIGAIRPPLNAEWPAELAAAQPELRALAGALSEAFDRGGRTLTTMGRCAAGLATLPVVARHHPDAVVVWFDAHGDCNVPDRSTTGYLGGMVLSGAAGLWESGLGAGLKLQNVVLVDGRDLDPFEAALIREGALAHIAPGPALAQALRVAIGDRPVYIHLDCDVLEPGIVPTEYEVPGGLSLAELKAAFEALATQRVVGLEIAELQDCWPNGEHADLEPLVAALAPLIGRG